MHVPRSVLEWRVAVGDTGRGIPEKDQHLVFQEFARLEHIPSQPSRERMLPGGKKITLDDREYAILQAVYQEASGRVARLISSFLKEEFRRSVLRGVQGLVAQSALEALRGRLDPRRYNGASLVGLNGIELKSHGSADQFAFENAVKAAIVEARKGVPVQIGKLIENRPH